METLRTTTNTTNSSSLDDKFRLLRDCVQCLRNAIDPITKPGQRDVDDLYAQYLEIRDQGATYCRSLLDCCLRRTDLFGSAAEVETEYCDGDDGGNCQERRRSSTSRPALTSMPILCPDQVADAAWLESVREWKSCLEHLVAEHKKSLADTYKRYEHVAAPEILDALFADWESRARVVSLWVKNFGGPYKRRHDQLNVAIKWQTQFQHYDQLVQDLSDIAELLRQQESGIPFSQRDIQEHIIAPRGDSILEFSNASTEGAPVHRFRVSSHMLSETSPIFARMFSKNDSEDGREDLKDDLPPPPTPFTCVDGSRVLVYRMPQIELNQDSSMTILLHAAHMHNDQVPRDITYEQFVAVAATSIRYRCSKPLDLVVEHRWLPQWIHKATDDIPDGLVLISYAFGMRCLFSRVTKTAILSLADESELQAKNWPAAIKDKMWAVRSTKVAQVVAACSSTISEYLNPIKVTTINSGSYSTTGITKTNEVTKVPAPDMTENQDKKTTYINSWRSSLVGSPPRSTAMTRPIQPPPPPPSSSSFSANTPTSIGFASSPSPGALDFSSTPRCPKGSHGCDATNLGWLMLVCNELQLLSGMFQPALSAGLKPPPQRSLAQMLDALRSMNSPPHPIHPGRGVCDPAPAFRSAINDIFNSVSGLTIAEIDGVRQDWVVSNKGLDEPTVAATLNLSDDSSAVTAPISRSISIPGTVSDSKVKSTDTHQGPKKLDSSSNGNGLPSAVTKALKEEHICAKILEAVETFGDLHAVAMVTPAFYTAYKKHELVIMRSIIKADRRRSAMTKLLANEHENQNTSYSTPTTLPARYNSAMGKRLSTIIPCTEEDKRRRRQRRRLYFDQSFVLNEDDDGFVQASSNSSRRNSSSSDFDSDSSNDETTASVPEDGSSTAPTTPVGSTSSITTDEEDKGDRDDDLPLSSSPPVQLAQIDGSTAYGDNDGDALLVMTEEEAYRIIWPHEATAAAAAASPPQSPRAAAAAAVRRQHNGDYPNILDPDIDQASSSSSGSGRNCEEEETPKYRASWILQGIEEKSLLIAGDKQLREDFDRRVGLIS